MFNSIHNKILDQRKFYERYGFPSNFYDTVKEEIKLILDKLCLKMRGQHNPDSKTRQEYYKKTTDQ